MSQSSPILVFHSQPQVRQMISLCLKGLTEVEIHEFDVAESAIRELQSLPRSMHLVLENGSRGQIILESAQQSATDIQAIWIGSGNQSPFVPIDQIPNLLVDTVRSQFFQGITRFNESDFCQLDSHLLTRSTYAMCDIYIRLSDKKYVKLFKAGTKFKKLDLDKLSSSQKIRKLYIQRTEIFDFIEKFKQKFLTETAALQEGSPDLVDLVADTQAVIQSLASQLGLSEEVRQLARENVDATMKMVGNSPRISQALAQTLNDNLSHTANHSVLLAHLSCSIAALMEMPSQTTFQKLVLASLFHDFALHDPHLAWKADNYNLDQLRLTLSAEEMQQILAHPLKAADAIRTIREIPGDVEFLVFQHHEKPDGTGFPKNLKAHQIVALSAVFIVSHEICNQIVREREKFSLEAFLSTTEKLYEYGAFKKVWKALKAHSLKMNASWAA
jgi:hypothetical protein